MAPPVDHCTGWFDGWWGDTCCAAHDKAYELGGTLLDWLTSNADLGACVAAFGGALSLANASAMAIGTTLLGLPFWIRAALRRRRLRRVPSETHL